MSSIICARITPKPSTASSTKKVKSVSQSPTKIPTPGALDTGVMKTARFAEAVNGRAAMQGHGTLAADTAASTSPWRL